MPQNPILIIQTPTLVFGDLGATFLSGEGWSGFSFVAMDFRVLSLELSESDLGRFEMRGSASGSGGGFVVWGFRSCKAGALEGAWDSITWLIKILCQYEYS